MLCTILFYSKIILFKLNLLSIISKFCEELLNIKHLINALTLQSWKIKARASNIFLPTGNKHSLHFQYESHVTPHRYN